MIARRTFTHAAVIATAMLALGGGLASAEMSKKVTGAFKGQLIVTKGALPEGKSEADTIAKIKADRLKEISGETNEDVTYWNFHYTAFLSKTGSSKLKMEFFRDGKQFSADKSLDGIDPKTGIIEGDISINEDEGLAKGKSYVIKLVNDKDVVVASTPLLMK